MSSDRVRELVKKGMQMFTHPDVVHAVNTAVNTLVQEIQNQDEGPTSSSRSKIRSSHSTRTISQNSSFAMDGSKLMQVDHKEDSLALVEEQQNEPFPQAQSILNYSKKLEDDLHAMGLKIKHHQDNINLLNTQKNKLDDFILHLQGVLRECHSSTPPNSETGEHSNNQTEDEKNEQILRHEKSAAGIFCQLKLHHRALVDQLAWTKDVLGFVATLGKVDDDSLSRLFSEYLGVDTMLAIVCKTYESMKSLETYNKEGIINKESGLHGLGASIDRALDGRFLVICLEHLRPYPGDFVTDDPQRRLDILKPRLPNGECPPGFLGFAVNMINVELMNVFCVTDSGYGLRETLFYNLFSRVQVYKTREEMICALPFIIDGAVSLDGGMIRSAGLFSLGSRNDVDIKFPKFSIKSALPDKYVDTEKQLKEMRWKKEKLIEDMKREQGLLVNAKYNFGEKKKEFVKFLAESSSYATQQQHHQAEKERLNPR